jgi:FixJ family two-component response regulator
MLKQRDRAAKAMKAGAVEFLTKPFGEDVLLGAIQNAIERSSAALAQGAGTRALQNDYASLSRGLPRPWTFRAPNSQSPAAA